MVRVRSVDAGGIWGKSEVFVACAVRRITETLFQFFKHRHAISTNAPLTPLTRVTFNSSSYPSARFSWPWIT
jgi:hypothetical protein